MNKRYPLADSDMRATVDWFEGGGSNGTGSVGLFGALWYVGYHTFKLILQGGEIVNLFRGG